MRFGAHVSASGGLARAAERAAELGCESFQLWTQNARTWRRTEHPPEEVEAFLAAAPAIGPAVAHAIYLINLAADDDDVYAKSVEALAETARNAATLGLLGVVFHVGSHKGAGLDATIDRIVAGIAPALDALPETGTWLLLENSAGAGGTIGRDVADLARVFEAVDDPRVGLCIDTCHAYVSGIDVREPAVVESWLAEIDGSFGLERLRCLHVNDSAAPFGSNRDRHAPLGAGELGDRLGVLLSHPALQDLPAILETQAADDGGYAPELSEVRRIHAAGLAARAAL